MPERSIAIITWFEELVRQHTSQLLQYAATHVSDIATAEDLVQTTFLAAWQARETFEERSSARTWLFSILRNKLADHYRKSYKDPVVHGPDPLVDEFDAKGNLQKDMRPEVWRTDEAQDAEAMSRYLQRCLDQLSANLRAAIEMKFLKGKDATAICQELKVSSTNYWQQLHRAKRKLRDCITEQLASP